MKCNVMQFIRWARLLALAYPPTLASATRRNVPPCRPTLLVLALLLLSNLGRAQLPVTYSWLANSFCASGTSSWTTTPWMYPNLTGVCAASNGTIYANGIYAEGGETILQFNGASGMLTAYASTAGGGYGGLAIACNSTYVFIAHTIYPNQNAPNTYPPSGTAWVGIEQRLRSNITQGQIPPFSGAKGGDFGYPQDFLVVDAITAGSSWPMPNDLQGVAANDSYLYASDPSNTGDVIEFNPSTMATITSWTCPALRQPGNR